MSIKNWMSSKVITVEPDTKVFAAADLMKENDIHRLPVVEKSGHKLVGLITEGTIHEATPSKATSLSVYEMNYLLNKTTVADVMVKEVITIQPVALLEDAIYTMRKNSVGVLPVMDDDNLVGIITDKDIFDAFLKISSYGVPGLRVSVVLHEDKPGLLASILKFVAEKNINVATTMVDRETKDYIVVQIQLLTTDLTIVDELKKASYDVANAVLTK